MSKKYNEPIIYAVPAWALCYFAYGQSDDLEESDTQRIDEFLSENEISFSGLVNSDDDGRNDDYDLFGGFANKVYDCYFFKNKNTTR